jgi:hypothetical protein
MKITIEAGGCFVEGENIDVTFKGWDMADDTTIRLFHMLEVRLQSFQQQIIDRMEELK